MTSSDNTDQTVKIPADNPQSDANQMTPCIFSRMWVFLLVLLIGIAGTTLLHSMKPELFAFAQVKATQPSGFIDYTGASARKDEQLAVLMKRVEELESTLTALKEKEAQPVTEKGEAIVAHDDFNKLKEGVKTLFETSEKIGHQLEAALSEAVTGQTHMRTSVAALITFMQMKDKALQGNAFDKELKNVEAMLSQKNPVQETLKKLEPFAQETVTSHVTLFLDWKTLAPKIELMLRQSNAKDWQERVMVALEGLISVKSLKEEEGMEQSLIATVHTDLLKANVKDALDNAKKLPTEIQERLLKDWIKKASQRVEVEMLLDKASSQLIPDAHKEKAESKKTEGKK